MLKSGFEMSLASLLRISKFIKASMSLFDLVYSLSRFPMKVDIPGVSYMPTKALTTSNFCESSVSSMTSVYCVYSSQMNNCSYLRSSNSKRCRLIIIC